MWNAGRANRHTCTAITVASMITALEITGPITADWITMRAGGEGERAYGD